jgi:hypothetical protein
MTAGDVFSEDELELLVERVAAPAPDELAGVELVLDSC